MTDDFSEQLRVDALYRNTNDWKKPEDQFNRFFRFKDGKGINNTSGFRPKSKSNSDSTNIEDCAFCVLVSNFGESEWPDTLNYELGQFTYYGDNRRPGSAISSTTVGGNRLLESIFSKLHSLDRKKIPPILFFEAAKENSTSHMKFLGLAAPGAQGLSSTDDLVAVWKVSSGLRFQNYKATFTILKEERVCKNWLEDLVSGLSPTESEYCPEAWSYWVGTGIYKSLECSRELIPRTKLEQLPQNKLEAKILKRLFEALSDREFEYACAELVKFVDPCFRDLVVTRASRDGGRDVIGSYYLGHEEHQIRLSAFIEAKKWKLDSAIGVKQVMRLISRIKKKDIGVFITTSYFDPQVQRELLEDGHPVMLISGGDIARLLIKADMETDSTLESWLDSVRYRASA